MQGDPLLAAAESAFGGGSDSSDESSDEETPAPLNAFALLGGDDDDDDDESAEEKEEEPEPVKEMTPPPASKKKKKKKQKQKQTPDDDGGDDEGEAVEDDGIDEITAALREIGEEMPAPRPDGDASSAADAASISGRDPLMCVDIRRLKAEDELRSIFGAKVIHAVETEEGNRGGVGLGGQRGLAHIGRNPRGRRPANQAPPKLASTTRSTLVQPKDSWPPLRAKSVGLAMECVGVEGQRRRRFASSATPPAPTPTPRTTARWRRTIPTTCTRCCSTGRGTSTRCRAVGRVPLRRGGVQIGRVVGAGAVRDGGRVAPVVRWVRRRRDRAHGRPRGARGCRWGCRRGCRRGCRGRQRAVLRDDVQARAGAHAAGLSQSRARVFQARAVPRQDRPAGFSVLRRLLRAAVRRGGLAPGLCGFVPSRREPPVASLVRVLDRAREARGRHAGSTLT